MDNGRRSTPVKARDASFDAMRAAMASEADEGRRFNAALLSRVLRAAGWDRAREESGEAGWVALAELEEELEGYAYAIAQDMSSAHWLWCLRRVGWMFEGHTPNAVSGQNEEELAESISAMSAARARLQSGQSAVPYAVDQAVARSVWRLASVSNLLHRVQVALLWAGKWAVVRSADGDLPVPAPTPDLVAMVNTWDRRVEAAGTGFLARAGLYTHTLGTMPDQSNFLNTVPIVGRTDSGEFGLKPFWMSQMPTLSDATLPLSIRWPTAVLDLLSLLWGSTFGDMINGERVEPEKESFRLTGFRTVTRSQALDELAAAVAILEGRRLGGGIPREVSFGSPDEILSRLTWSGVSIWPASLGPAIRMAEDGLLFEDLYATSARLGDALARSPLLTGELANAWSKHFEATIQAALDDSPWRPSPTLAALRGKHLRVPGSTSRVTEIDAIGEMGDRLLLVSCKCVPFSDRWNRGEPKTVRNEASAVDDAVEEWTDRMAKLRNVPRGDNYDFTGYREIIGVVVFPSPPWSPTASSVAEVVPGLRVAASANEFGEWIRARRPAIDAGPPRSRRH